MILIFGCLTKVLPAPLALAPELLLHGARDGRHGAPHVRLGLAQPVGLSGGGRRGGQEEAGAILLALLQVGRIGQELGRQRLLQKLQRTQL